MERRGSLAEFIYARGGLQYQVVTRATPNQSTFSVSHEPERGIQARRFALRIPARVLQVYLCPEEQEFHQRSDCGASSSSTTTQLIAASQVGCFSFI